LIWIDDRRMSITRDQVYHNDGFSLDFEDVNRNEFHLFKINQIYLVTKYNCWYNDK